MLYWHIIYLFRADWRIILVHNARLNTLNFTYYMYRICYSLSLSISDIYILSLQLHVLIDKKNSTCNINFLLQTIDHWNFFDLLTIHGGGGGFSIHLQPWKQHMVNFPPKVMYNSYINAIHAPQNRKYMN